MKIRIIKQPKGVLEGLLLDRYRIGMVYDLPPNLANYLVVEGFAIFESREASGAKPPVIERRKKPW